MPDITTVLIANRGEIARRVIRTLREMGIRSVAVYHPVDRDAPHVREADEAIAIDGTSPVAAYLDSGAIVAACRKSGADAVHPGYGFLSENAAFAEQLTAAGIAFIGPLPDAMTAMGDKIASKKIAAQAGVTTIPGHPDPLRDAEDAVQASRRIGYPVMLKASAGGGGKGMRIARDDEQCREGFERATREARSSFGDERILVEKYIDQPRHIEIQILADAHGNVVHLGERECSIQRRHQKVIEEAPSPFIDVTTRSAMGEQAVALAKAVNYRSAGTVEFIADAQRNFYFLEMNTRLQVEHPVTEMITGLDLVAEQVRIARGELLAFRQEDISFTGHAIECRLYAEDADHEFAPATGKVLAFQAPTGEGVRLDGGIEAGVAVTSSFDPMLAKLVTHGDTRQQAIDRARQALGDTVLLGVITNAAFLNRILAHPEFAAGELHTGFLEQHEEALRRPAATQEQLDVVLATACLSSRAFTDPRYLAPRPINGMGEWRN